jgi:endonuclease/exonuclease/phosphatase family metal-dependent hydrolase
VGPLVIQSWNCFGAAQSALSFFRWRGVPDAHRLAHPAVRATAHEVDILCMQELFLGETEAFFDELPHTHKTRDHNRTVLWPLTVGGSGLGLASRLPIVERSLRPFSRPHVGSERFARKGVLHARVLVREDPRLEVDVVTTHLQSGLGTSAASVRARQLAELRGLVDAVGSSERPFVLCGDLNICGLSESRVAGEYQHIRDKLHDFLDLGGDDDLPTFHPDPEVNGLAHRFEGHGPRQRLDYMLFRPDNDGALSAEGCELVLSAVLEGHGPRTWASDHFALRAVFRPAPRPARAP